MKHYPLLLLAACAALLIGCGGGDSGHSSSIPTLVGTPFPTVTDIPPTAAVCDPPAQLPFPADFPADVAVPPDFVTWKVDTSPYLHVEGRVTPPNPNSDVPRGIVGTALSNALKANHVWATQLNQRVDGLDVTFFAADGRRGHFNALDAPGCDGQVILVYDIPWVTP